MLSDPTSNCWRSCSISQAIASRRGASWRHGRHHRCARPGQ
ncbi:hypothetical protein I553_9421 [Mycobacterium xenopi 4042]|uniref:Uncharacterized protein n=1 Tax=Mycobacterium xenopi 4042 TaxID=1299334 RepID=X8E0E1_MYCXE|nr:hypothetical protein I553_9421 [Mycobacterium xenopi 4042]